MKGYQRGDKPKQTEARALADVETRRPSMSQDLMHMGRPEGGSVCIRGRTSYFLAEDPALVTCKRCLKLMAEEEKK